MKKILVHNEIRTHAQHNPQIRRQTSFHTTTMSDERHHLKLVRTPLNVYFTAFKSSFLSLYAHINSDECHA